MVDQNDKLQREILRLTDQGHKLLLLQPNGKPPLGAAFPHGCKDATSDGEYLCDLVESYLNANLGLYAGGMLVIDIDVKDGGHNPWFDSDEFKSLPDAPKSRTASGGMHIFLKLPPGVKVKNSVKAIAPGVDTRTDNGYAVVFPSVVDGKPYQWVPGYELGSIDDLPTAPDWIVERLIVKESEPFKLEGNKIPYGTQWDSLRRFAGVIAGTGAGYDVINDSLQTMNRTQCEKPGTPQEIEKLARAAAEKFAPNQQTQSYVECWDKQYLAPDPDEIEPSDSPDDPGPFPQSLLKVPGLMSMAMDYNLATAHKPQPELALAAAITLMAVLTGRTISDKYGTRTNLYILGVCKSGGGKENARKVNKDILTEAGAENLIGPEGLASHAGLVTAVTLNPCLLLQLDEVGRMLRVLSNPSAAPHLSGIITVLMKMFTASNTTYIGDAYADKDRNRTIDQPHVCIYATTVPKSLYEGFSAESITDGFLGRMLIFEATDHAPQRQRPAFMPIPQELIEQVRYWHQFNPCGLAQHVRPRPQIIEYDDRAEEVFEALETEAYQHQIGDNEMIASLWTRTNEKARKLALIYACSESTQSPLVGVAAAQWACDLSRYLTRQLIHTASDWIAENPFDETRKKVLRIIKGAGNKGLTASQLCRKTQEIRKRDRDEILHNLLSSGIVKQETINQRTKPKTVYIAQ